MTSNKEQNTGIPTDETRDELNAPQGEEIMRLRDDVWAVIWDSRNGKQLPVELTRAALASLNDLADIANALALRSRRCNCPNCPNQHHFIGNAPANKRDTNETQDGQAF